MRWSRRARALRAAPRRVRALLGAARRAPGGSRRTRVRRRRPRASGVAPWRILESARAESSAKIMCSRAGGGPCRRWRRSPPWRPALPSASASGPTRSRTPSTRNEAPRPTMRAPSSCSGRALRSRRSPAAKAGCWSRAAEARPPLSSAAFLALPGDKTYEAWVIEGKTARRLGSSAGVAAAHRSCSQQEVPAGAIVAVTLERAGGVPQPTSAILVHTGAV